MKKSNLKNFLINLKPHKKLIIISIIFCLISSLVVIISPRIIETLIDSIEKRNDILYYSLLLIIMYFIQLITSYIAKFIITLANRRVCGNLRSVIYEKIRTVKLDYFKKEQTGIVLSNITSDVDTIGICLNQYILYFFNSIIIFIGLPFIMLLTSLKLFIVTFIFMIISYLIIIFIVLKSQKHYINHQKNLGNLSSVVQKTVSSLSIINIYNLKKKKIDEFDYVNNNIFTNSLKSQFFSNLLIPILNFLFSISFVVIILYGSYLLSLNEVSLGIIVAFVIYTKLFQNPVTFLTNATTFFQLLLSAFENIYEFLDYEDKQKTTNLDLKDIEIEFKNLTYIDNQVLIDNLNLVIPKNKVSAIIGEVGCGKTILIKILLNILPKTSGDIFINGQKLLNNNSLTNFTSFVSQENDLFYETILDNITEKNDICIQKVNEVIKLLKLDHFISCLKDGINTNISDIENISSGQKQLILLSKVILLNKELIILDEATRNIDYNTENTILRKIKSLNKTTLIIANSYSSIKYADFIVIMKNGVIQDSGSFEKLSQTNSYFQKFKQY